MNMEAKNELLLRSRRHAALGEPARLAMVDQLLLGDSSPGELGDLVGLPTNLLSHHLRALDDAGLIRRVRSEGDRRRSYVQLRLDDPGVAALLSGQAPGRLRAGNRNGPRVSRVVFVCTRNSARSQLAAALWSRVSSIPTASAGTHPAARVHPRAVATGRRHGLGLARTGTRSLAETMSRGDLLVAVCDSAHEELAARSSAGSLPGWLHWAVADPVRAGTDAAFEAAYQCVAARVDRLAAALEPTRRP